MGTSAAASVLVADDDRDIRDLVAFKLTQAGYSVLTVADGTAALSALLEQRPTSRCSTS